MGAVLDGWHSDAARTFAVGKISDEAQKLIDVTRESFFEGIKHLKHGAKLGDVSSAIQQYVESYGYGVVRDLVGHGIGTHLHEDPSVPNFGTAGKGVKLAAGMTLAIEPMVNMGTHKVCVLDDDWTVVTADGSLSAHYENTVLITKDGYEILTL
jgi:methionyl aminopeptidase